MALSKAMALFGWDTPSVPLVGSCAQGDPAFPAARLIYNSLFNGFRSNEGTVTGVQIVLQLPPGTMVQGVMIHGTNWTPASATAKVEFTTSDPAFGAGNILAGSDVAAAAAFNVTNLGPAPFLPPWGWPYLRLFTNPIGPSGWMRVTVDDAANAAGYVGAEIARAGTIWQPGINMDGASWSKNDNIEGELGVQIVRRGHQVTFHRLSWHDEATLFSISRFLRSSGRLMVVPQPNDTSTWLNDALWCTFDTSAGGGGGTGNSLSSTPVSNLPTYKSCQAAFREVNR